MLATCRSFLLSKTDALDVEKESEYQEMVAKIAESNFSKISIIVDMNDVKRKCPIDVSALPVPLIYSDGIFAARHAQYR